MRKEKIFMLIALFSAFILLRYNTAIEYNCPDRSYIPIITADALQNMEIDKNYCLFNNITLTGNFEPIGYPAKDITGKRFTGSKFVGKFDGNNKTINGLSIDKAAAKYIGLFANIGANGEVKNLIIRNPSVKGNDHVGILAGDNQGTIDNVRIEETSDTVTQKSYSNGLVETDDRNATEQNSEANGQIQKQYFEENGIEGLEESNRSAVENSDTNENAVEQDFENYIIGDVEENDRNAMEENDYAKEIVTGKHKVGGLVGENYNRGTITNSYANGNVSGGSKVGGLLGSNREGTITNSYASGNVSGKSSVGGLLGYNDGIIGDSYADGNVAGKDKVGGLVGENKRGIIKNSYANGEIKGKDAIGGLTGANKMGTVRNSYATGNVTGTGWAVAGLVGWNAYRSIVTNSYSTGTISGERDVGGIVGDNWGTVTNSYASGNVTARTYVGGLVGDNWGGTIADSYAVGVVTGERDRGGLVGRNYYRASIANSYFDNTRTGQTDGVGFDNNNQTITGITTGSIVNGGTQPFQDAGWNFTKIWSAIGNGQWPTLK